MAKIDLVKITGKDISEIDKNYDNSIYSIANRTRKEAAKRILSLDKTDWKKIDVKSSMLKFVMERTPFPNTEEILQFNIAITDVACEMVLQSNVNLIEKIGTYANVVEIGAREFITPYNIEVVYKNLTAAKEMGFFFTPPSLAIRMVIASIENSVNSETVIDPAAGVGTFLAYHILLNPDIKNVLGIEIDSHTIRLGNELLRYVSNEICNPVKITMLCANFFDYFDSKKGELHADLLIMNPPYGSVKMLASDLTDSSTKAEMSKEAMTVLENKLKKRTIDRASKLRKQFSAYGIGRGVLEYSKLFMAAATDLLSPNGVLVAITPSSWLGDETSAEFRESVLYNGWIQELWLIPERAKMFKGVNQPTAVSILKKNKSQTVKVYNPVLKVSDLEKKPYLFNLDKVVSVSGLKHKFPNCSVNELKLLSKIHKFGKIKNIKGIVNVRGELDLTAHKRFVSFQETACRLIRGDHIQGSVLMPTAESNKAGFVFFEEFINAIRKSEKSKYCMNPRIAIAQCSYLQKKKRIEAAIVPKGVILGNSCNFLAVSESEHLREALLYYWMVLNSSVTEWQFRIFSYNNHIANKEIDEFACIPYADLPAKYKEAISNECFNKKFGYKFSAKHDALVANIYKLSYEDYRTILNSLNYENIDSYLMEYQK